MSEICFEGDVLGAYGCDKCSCIYEKYKIESRKIYN